VSGSTDYRRRALALSGLVIPAVVLGLLRLGSRTPAPAAALVPEIVSDGSEMPAPAPPDPRIPAATKFVRTWSPATELNSPLYYPTLAAKSEVSVVSESAPARNDQAGERKRAVPQFRVTSIMGRGQSAIATVNGRVCRIGAEVEGWRVAAIDPATRVVEFVGPDGSRATASPEERGPR